MTPHAIREVWLATPCHGQPSMGFALSFSATVSELAHLGFGVVPRIVPGQAHIDLVRSGIASKFLRAPSHPDVLVFIDSDEEWSPREVVILLEAIAQGLEVVGAAVPGKLFDWEAIRAAACAGAGAEELAQAGLHYAYELDKDDVDADRGYIGPVVTLERSGAKLVRVPHHGTGFLAIHRDALERVAAAHPDLAVDVPMAGPVLFQSAIVEHPTGRRHETEDFSFLHRYRRLGGTVWMHYAARIGHEGLYTWRGDGSEQALDRQARRYAHITRTPAWRDYLP